MTAVDTNILVYAHREDSTHHRAALQTITNLVEGTFDWAIPWPCLHEFLAIVTHPRIYMPPTPLEDALIQVDRWVEAPGVRLIGEGSAAYWPVLRKILASGGIAGPRVHDARIAAICLRHGVDRLLSADRDFSRFPDLRTVNPLL
ncbi:MAG TPA: TA system VapC family ribonuclease toxin [Spirochaetia bacterium]|nr:TA system VapC family ribonuclease toxin [Spirochaetia bacterium]